MIKAALIGCGVIGPTHAKALALDGRVELAWACDLDPAKAEKIAGAQRRTADYREVLADPAVELVCIATPHQTHVEICCAALDAGKHVICEKPLATRPEDVARMVAAAEQTGLMASGIFQHRFGPLARRLHELLRAGDFGPVTAAELVFRTKRTADYYASAAWRGRWDGEGGGLMINQVIHHLDLLDWFCGEPQTVTGRVERRRLATIEVEDWAEATIGFAGGATATVSAVNDLETDWFSRLSVRCRHGSFTLDGDQLQALDHPSLALRAELEALDRIRLDGIKMPGKDCYGDQHALQIQDCVSAVLAGRRPFVALADAAVTAQVVLGIYHSATTGRTVNLPVVDAYRQPRLEHMTPKELA
jgi:predicted dehydrogenase